MVRKSLLGVLGCALVASVAVANESPVTVTVSNSVTSTYVWNGFDRVESYGLDAGAAIQPQVSVGVKNTGFAVHVGGSFVVNDDSQLHETTYGVSVGRSVSPVVSFGAGYNYYDNRAKVGGVAVEDGDGHEVWGGVELASGVGLKPGVTVKYEKSTTDGVDAFAVVVGSVKYAVPLTGVTVGGAGVDMNWKTGVVYNSGVKVNGVEAVKGGVSAWQVGVASDIKAGRVVVTPSVNYQVSLEDTVNPDNEFWATVGVAYGF